MFNQKSMYMTEILNIIGNKIIRPEDSDNILEIRKMFEPRIIASMPDISHYDFYRVMGEAKKKYSYWKELPFSKKIEIFEKVGHEVFKDEDYDIPIALAGGNPVKYVREDRKNMAKLAINSERYLNNIFNGNSIKHDLIEGKGVVAVVASSTVYSTQPWVVLESLYGGNSVIIKLDSQEPFSGFQFSYHLNKHGAPVQIISYSRENGKSDWARKLYKKTDVMPIMGSPQTIFDIVYYDLLTELRNNGKSENEINEIKRNLPIPDKVVALVTHGGLGYIDKSADIEKAVEETVKGATRNIRSCKRMREIVIHPDIYETTLKKLAEKMESLYVGDVGDFNSDVPQVDETFWENNVEPYIRTALGEGEIILGGEMNQPTIIYNSPDSLLGQECTYAIISVKRGDFNRALEVCKKMADTQLKKRILEFSIFSRNENQIEYANRHAPAFNVHWNESTIESVGKPHEGIYLVRELSYSKADRPVAGFMKAMKNFISIFI